MNKNLYRIVFNQARGMLMVVAEIARAGRIASPSTDTLHLHSRLIGKVSALSFSLWLALGAIYPSHAAIVANGAATKNQQPTIVATANGTPQVNIQTPTGAGVSRNSFSRFDVDQKGVILNNATRNAKTELAGMVAANPWLARGEAKVILNEISSRDPSKLNGMIEVAGEKAQVVIANPAGITCDGCGFINAHRTTLTTGQVQLSNGQISGYDVQRGDIVIQGHGMDSSRVDSTDLIARAVNVNAGIWANALKVTTGSNRVDASHQTVTAQAAEAASQPQFAVDVAQLGGMYASKIHLRGTEHGVGVRNAGVIGASAGEVVVNADGTLTNSGQIQARDNVHLTSRSGIHSSGVLAAGIKKDGSSLTTGDLTLNSSGALRVSGQNQAPGKLTAQGTEIDFSTSQNRATHIELSANTGDIRTAQASVEARSFTARTQGTLDNDGGNITADTLALTARKLSNRKGVLQQRGESSLTLAHADGIDNRGGAIVSAGAKLTLSGKALDNQQGRLQANALFVDTATSSINNQQGVMTASREINLQSGGLNNDTGLVQAGSALSVDLRGGALSNRNSGENSGLLSFGTLTLDGGALDNTGGYIAAAGDSLVNGLTLENTHGTLYSAANLNLSTSTLTNTQGVIQAGVNLMLDTRGQALSNDQGSISAGQNLTLQSAALHNEDGRIVAGAALTLNTQANPLNNQLGTLASGGSMQLESSVLSNLSGQIQAAGKLSIDAQTLLDNSAGLIRSGSVATLKTGQLLNRKTRDQQLGIEGVAVNLSTPLLDNSEGAIRSGDSLIVNTLTLLDNSRGLLSSAGQLDVNGGETLALTNTGGTLIAGSALNLSAGSASGDGKLLSQNAMQLTLQKAFLNTGEVIANGSITFTLARGLVNESLIKAGQALTLKAKTLTNRVNAEIGAGENHLLIEGTLTNRGLLDGGLTHLSAATLNNYATGRIYGDHVALDAATLNNEAKNGVAPVIAARERLDIAANTLNNSGHALIYSAGEMAIGGQLNPQYLAQGQALILNNKGATVESAGNMFLNVATLNNLNAGMKTKVVVVVERSTHHEASLAGSENRFDWADVYVGNKNKYDVHQATMPDGTKGREFYEYNYQRVVKETQVTATDPGKIIAGGSIIFNSQQINNQDSRIVAGGLLGGTLGELNNLATTGVRITTDTGSQTRWAAKKGRTKRGTPKTSQGRKTSAYKPAPTTQTIDLKQMAWLSHTLESGNDTTIANRNTRGMTTDTARTGAVSPALPGQIREIGHGENSVIRLTPPDIRLPDNSLFQLRLSGDVPFLIETDPRFTHQRTWLGSDYMQRQFKLDANNMLKRLGDGFYEQRLIREQIIQLTGNRYLYGFNNDETQFRALMDAGVAFGHRYNLAPGVALTAEQMALLTSDMVWLVKQEITLADGKTQQVLVPQVYAKVQKGDLDGSGALLTASNIALNLGQDLTNSGRISGREVTQITAENLTNHGFIGARNLNLLARADISNIGGTLQGNDSLNLAAGRDINSVTTTQGDAANRWIDRPASLFVLNDSGTLSLNALNNITLTGSQVSNAGANSRTQIVAGNDLNLDTVATARTEYGNWGKGNSRHLEQSVETGSQINSRGDVALYAGHDINARAASMTAKTDLVVAAENDVNLTSGESSYHLTEKSRQRTSGLLSKKTTTTHDEVWQTTAKGSLLSGDNVTVQAGNNVLVQGSSIAGDGNVILNAGSNIDIVAASNSRAAWHVKETKKSGVMGTGGIGVTVGTSTSNLDVRERNTTQSGSFSTVGSTAGNVSIAAGKQVQIAGADIIARQNLAISGEKVVIAPGQDSLTRHQTWEQKSSGLTLALSGAAGSAVNSAIQTAREAEGESDSRLAALQATKAALSGVQAVQGVAVAQATADPGNGFGISASLTSQKSTSVQHSRSDSVAGSTLTAGNDLAITATDGDLLIHAGQLKAGGDSTLSAANDIVLSGAANRQQTTGKNSSSGGGVGVGIGGGTGGAGISVFANVNAASGKEQGNGTAWTETTLDSGGTISMTSGRDAILNGAQLSGNRIEADIGRDLRMHSQQDSNDYRSRQTSVAAGGSFTLGSMTGSGYLSASQDKMKSNYDSVQEQTGLFAGSGGFDVRVGRHTQLDGAVMASSALAEKNRLDTGTLGFSDIHNEADFKVSHSGASLSGGGSFGGEKFAGNMAGGMIAAGGNRGHEEGTTRAAVAQGTLVVRDQAAQQQDVAALSRDTENANGSIQQIFDKEKEQKRLQTISLIADMAGQAADIARTQGEIAALNEARKTINAPGADATDGEREAYVKALRESDAYKAEMKKYGTGSDLQRGIQAATAALQGLAGGDVGAALAGAAAPQLAHLLKSTEDSPAVNALAHAILGGAVAALQGNSVAAGAAGAAAGELAARAVAGMLYPEVTDLDDLSEEQRQTISTLATISAGLAGGLAGDSTASVAAGAQAGKNAVENNSLAHVLAAAEANKPGTVESWTKEQQAAIREACSGGTPVSCETAVAAMGSAMAWPLLPGTAAATSLIGAGANAGVGLLINGEVNPNDVVLGYWTGALTAGTGLWGTMGWNAASGATSSYLKGDDPLKGGAISGVASGIGYGIGNKLIKPGLDKVFNPNWKSWEWTKLDMGITKPLSLDPLPGVAGNIFGSGTTEFSNDQTGKWFNDHLEAKNEE